MEERYELQREGDERILLFDYENEPEVPSLEDSPTCMARTVDTIVKIGAVTKIVYSQKRDFEYDYSQTRLLVEIALIYKSFVREKFLQGLQDLLADTTSTSVIRIKYTSLQKLFYQTLKADPIGAFVELRRILQMEKFEGYLEPQYVQWEEQFIAVLTRLYTLLEKSSLIQIVKAHLSAHRVGSRQIYRTVFSPTVKPDFMFTKLQAEYPPHGILDESYSVGETEVSLFSFSDSVRNLYHIMPPEFTLTEEQYELLDLARNVMAEHQPTKKDFVQPDQMREIFSKIGRDLIEDLAGSKGLSISTVEADTLTNILIRYTVGFGLIEVLLQDEKVQDISVNSPMGHLTIFIVHQDYGDCYTNIIPTPSEAESWASKLRMISGRPLDESNQILDTELNLPGVSARVSAITAPLDPSGIAFSFRRHRDRPWTLPLFIKYKMINPLAAGLISFLIDGTRTMLVSGTRSSGKSSFLGSILVEIMRRHRIITIEDTLELPVPQLLKLGFNIQQMKVAGALAKEGSEMTATDGIRATLRLGDSALFVGEVRSKEAISLYEAMRVGAAANVVAGTIHADSPYGVFDRVVNDIGVPRTSFKATDIIMVANPIKTASSVHSTRRITSITEIRKTWEQDPLTENGFVDLMKYDVTTDELLPTSAFLNGDSEVLKAIAANIKGLAGNWDAVWDNIQLRAHIKGTLVELADKHNRFDILEAPFVIKSNDVYHNIVGRIQAESGHLDADRTFSEWNAWVQREVFKQ